MNKLPQLEQRIREKIEMAKSEIHPAHNKIYLESLRILERLLKAHIEE